MMNYKIVERVYVDNLMDSLRFKLDTFPNLDYQPLPWLQMKKARRAVGVQSRWQKIDKLLASLNVNTGLDIGSNVGYFSISLAKRNISVIAAESHSKYIRILQYAIKKLGLHDKVGILNWKVTPTTVTMLPEVDCIIFLAVWHHIVREFGLEDATNLLQHLWSKTRIVLFFETGEDEMPEEWGLPKMEPDPQAFLQQFLQDVCIGGRIDHLGVHDAFNPNGEDVKRNLFAIVRGNT